MSWWDKVKEIAKRESGAVREEVGKATDALDEALAKKERELHATPAERVDMIIDEIQDEDIRFRKIEDRLREEGSLRAGAAGIEPPVPTVEADPQLEGVRSALVVAPVEPGALRDKTSHRVTIDRHLLAAAGDAGFDAAVADLQVEVMVLDVTRRGDTIALRTPTLTNDEVADLVARAVARHLPAPPDTEPDDAPSNVLGDSES